MRRWLGLFLNRLVSQTAQFPSARQPAYLPTAMVLNADCILESLGKLFNNSDVWGWTRRVHLYLPRNSD